MKVALIQVGFLGGAGALGPLVGAGTLGPLVGAGTFGGAGARGWVREFSLGVLEILFCRVPLMTS